MVLKGVTVVDTRSGELTLGRAVLIRYARSSRSSRRNSAAELSR